MTVISLQRRNGTVIRFECSLTLAEAREIVIGAHKAHQNVGDFALKLATQRSALTENQSGWLKYLAMEISGQLRTQTTRGPWAWLLTIPKHEAEGIQISSPPDLEDGTPREPCRWVRVKLGKEWRYVGRVDCHGSFWFSREITDLINGIGRGAMVMMFPDEEQRLVDEAKRLQWIATQKMEALKNHE
jgi:hypothetical protein